jgi:hypothetical protein
MSTETKDRDLQEIGRNAYSSIVEMVAALECDYERLAELREERSELDADYYRAVQARVEGDELTELHRALSAWDEENGEELAELVAAAGECESREDAEQRIQEDPLSLEVRSGWTSLGEPFAAEEFNILLATGGPAVRIVGELSGGEPSRAWLEVQDWFTPWTQYIGADQDVLLTYARCFYFGE